jgi:transporter family protein
MQLTVARLRRQEVCLFSSNAWAGADLVPIGSSLLIWRYDSSMPLRSARPGGGPVTVRNLPIMSKRAIAMSTTWLPWALGSALFAALTAVLAKKGLGGVDSDFATLVRTAIVVIVLGSFVAFTGKWRSPFALPSRSLLYLTLSAVATGGSWLCYFRALKVGDASRVAPVDKLSVVLVAVFATMFLGERLSVREWLGVGLVTAGVVVLAVRR